MNIHCALKVIEKARQEGVKVFCLCPGGRCAPFVEVLSRLKDVEVFYFFDERAAGFFALGRAKRDQKPCAVITTSGTAASELYSCVIEAYYSSAPLILITADRPLEYRFTGAPQCIDQVNLFSNYTDKTLDISANKKIKDFQWNKIRPLHLNVRFDEPLVDQELNSLDLKTKPIQKKEPLPQFNFFQKQKIKKIFKNKKILVLLSGLSPSFPKKKLINFLLDFNRPIFAEPLSQLRENTALKPLILKSDEWILKKSLQEDLLDSVLRIGSVPVCRFWRDINEHSHIPVLSLAHSQFSGLKKREKAYSLEAFLEQPFFEKNSKKDDRIFHADQKQALVLENQIQPESEAAWIRRLSEHFPKNSHIFLGNSLPIRLWNAFASRENKNFIYTANRGANGIDGLLSSFFGLCQKDKPNFCVIGDLSALYDLSAPWILEQMKNFTIHIIVMNNFGGRIFTKFKNEAYLNTHQRNFKNFSEMWGLHYQLIKNPVFSAFPPAPSLTEIQIST